MWSWSVVENFSLNCLLISISGNSTWIELEGGRQDGKKNEVFIFLFFFVNSFVHFSLQRFVTTTIKCKASFSCHSSSSHYSTQGFVLISFHLIFSFLKNKKKKYYAISHVTFCCVYRYQTQIWTGMRKKYDKIVVSKCILERKHFRFLDCTSFSDLGQKVVPTFNS